MDKITNVKFVNCTESKYISPTRMEYEQDGIKKFWDMLTIHDSVAIVLFNVTRKVLIFVKQFRPPLLCQMIKSDKKDMSGAVDVSMYPLSSAISLEMCAGIVDKPHQSLVETARDEILEECGYDVPLSAIEKVTSYRDVSVLATHQHLYFAQVTDAMRVSDGGGNEHEGEFIEVVEMDVPTARSIVLDESVAKPPTFMFALMWFLHVKLPTLQE